jgi:mannose-6-phosphate isomerase-like protein (cupin superfamily)
MENTSQSGHLDKFEFENASQSVEFVETINVVDGVKCDVYKFNGDNTKDLGIINIGPGKKTPLQKVLSGEKTIEGYVSGNGKLVIKRNNGEEEVHEVKDGDSPLSVDIEVGETMQWEASPDSKLVAYEVCIPPYEPGRFKNLS